MNFYIKIYLKQKIFSLNLKEKFFLIKVFLLLKLLKTLFKFL